MADDGITLAEAAQRYLAGISPEERIAHQVGVERFVRWLGGDRNFRQLRGQEIANYGETLPGSVTDAAGRADAVRKFLAASKQAGYSETNLGTHLRVKKMASAPRGSRAARKQVEVSANEKALLEGELESLIAQRPRIIEDLKRARADKDFRENAPLDAARQEQGHVEGRIRELEAKLDSAVVVEDVRTGSGHVVEIGSTVRLKIAASGKEQTYTLVRPGEVDAARGRISIESPVGQALMARSAGEEVEVKTPSGTMRFLIEGVEG